MDYFNQEEERIERVRQEGNGRFAKQGGMSHMSSSQKSVVNDSSTNFGTVQPNHGASLMVDIDAGGLSHNRSVEVEVVKEKEKSPVRKSSALPRFKPIKEESDKTEKAPTVHELSIHNLQKNLYNAQSGLSNAVSSSASIYSNKRPTKDANVLNL